MFGVGIGFRPAERTRLVGSVEETIVKPKRRRGINSLGIRRQIRQKSLHSSPWDHQSNPLRS